MSDVTFDFRQLKCPSRCVIDAYNAYVSHSGIATRATFAIPVMELDSDGRASSNPVVMLSAEISDTEITLLGELKLASTRIVVNLPFREEEKVEVDIIGATPFESAWVYHGAFVSKRNQRDDGDADIDRPGQEEFPHGTQTNGLPS